MKKFLPVIFLIILVIVGFYLRYRFIAIGDFWLDEAFTGSFIKDGWSKLFENIVVDLVHPPLYYILVKIWCDIFGNYSVFTIRLFSIVFGVMLIPSVFLFTSVLVKKGVKSLFPYLVAIVFTFNPFFISYSLEARSYALLAVLGVLNAAAFLYLLKKKEKKYLLIFVTLSVLLVLTHYISVIYLLSLGGLYYIITIIEDKKINRGQLLKKLIRIFLLPLLTFTICISGYLLLRPYYIGNEARIGVGGGWIPSVVISNLPTSLYNFVFGVQSQTLGVPSSNEFSISWVHPQTVGAILIISFVILILYFLFVSNKPKKNIITLSLLSIVPIFGVIALSKIGVNMYVERYMIILGIFWVILFVYLLFKTNKVVAISLVAVYVVLTFFVKYYVPGSMHSDICKMIDNRGSIMIDDAGDFIIVNYYCNPKYGDIKLYTKDREYYKSAWLFIRYERTVDSIDGAKYFISRNSITSDSFVEIGKSSELILYEIKD